MWEGISPLIFADLIIQCSYQFQTQSVVKRKCVCLKENVQQINISFKNYTENVVLLQVKSLIQIIVKLRADKIVCMFLSCIKHPFLWSKKYRTRKRLCGNTLKVYFSLKGNKFTCFAKVPFEYMIWFVISEKKASRGACFTWCMHAPKVSKQCMKMCTRISNSLRL